MIEEISNPELNSFSDTHVLSVGFGIIGLTFAITGYKIINLLKINYVYYYTLNKKKLILSTCALSIPMFFRALWDGLL